MKQKQPEFTEEFKNESESQTQAKFKTFIEKSNFQSETLRFFGDPM